MKNKIFLVTLGLCLAIDNANALGHVVKGGGGSSSSSSSSVSSSSSSSSSSVSSSSSSSSSSVSSSSSSSSSSVSGTTYTAKIVTIAATSSCISHSWTGRGTAPRGYIKGIALAYARSLCRLSSPSTAVRAPASIMDEGNTGNDVHDSISWYNSNFRNIGINNDNAGPDTLRSDYTLAIGLGMRESSGAYCVGHDTSAGSETASTAETGTFQVSYGSMGASSQLSALYNEYQNNTSKCQLDIWSEGASCGSGDWANVGSGAGASFQSFTKNCPAFGAEYAALLLRVLGGSNGEFGPIDRKEAELNLSCNSMLGQVETLVLNNESVACSELE